MKKLFTLVALLTCFLGAKAEWVEDYKVDYSTRTSFPFFVMGYVPEWVDGVMTDYGANYKYVAKATKDNEGNITYSEETSDVIIDLGNGEDDTKKYYKIALESPAWHQYFIADGIVTELGGAYTVKAMVKASEACTINVNMGWGWNPGESVGASVSIGTEWQEVEWEYSDIGGTSCNLVAQPGETTATIEWKYLTVSHNQKPQRPVTWIEQLTNGDECAQMINKPFEKEMEGITGADVAALVKQAPSQTIDGAKVYVVNAPAVDVEAYKTKNQKGDDITNNYAWANQFFIVSPVPFKAGEIIKVEFDYKADKEANTNTQAHGQPTYYQQHGILGDVKFTTEWQPFSKQVTISGEQAGANGMYSIAFNLNPDMKEENTYYFKNLSVSTMKLDHGYFITGANSNAGIQFDYDNAIEFTAGNNGVYTATVGEKNAYVSQIMISTVRGHNGAFLAAALKPASNDANQWVDYSNVSQAKIDLPGVGIWKVTIRETNGKMRFELVEGTLNKEIKPNPTKVVVAGTEREYTKDEEAPEGYEFKKNDNEEPIYGFPWDNQFCIKANRPLKAGETVTVSFKYKASKPAKVGTQIGGEELGAWMQGEALGDIEFTTEEQPFNKTFNATEGMQTITFNMAVVKEAITYEVYDIVWKLGSGAESLIDEEGSKNFNVKVGAGTFEQLGGETAIQNVVAAKKAVPAGKFNIAGQRVSDNYKGVVVEGGRIYLSK